MLLLLVLLGPMSAKMLRLPGLVGLIAAGMLVGPNVLHIVSGGVLIHALGFVGLLYLMFQGGLDLDLDGFVKHRRISVVFGTLTFLLPMAGVVGAALWLEVPWLAALIIGSALTSHTPLAYPAIARFDLSRNPSVTAALGATLLVNVLALLVLAIAAAGATGQTTTLEWTIFGVGLVVYLVLMLVGLPRVTRWFFSGLGQDRDVRLTYLLSGMGFSAVLAGVMGIEPIVGAFLAGLAFNRFVPDGTLIADRVQVLGRSLFVPAFLISTGMMLDPVALVTDSRTLLLGAALTVAMVVTKWLASSSTGLMMRATRPERGLMFSLTVGQAAGTLAAVVVGEELGLLGETEINAVVLVIIVAAILAGVFSERNAPKVEPPGKEGRSLGKRVVVPVSNPHTVSSLVRVAGQVAAPDSGAVVAVNVLPFDAEPALVRAHRNLAGDAERAALAVGAEVHTSVRIDASIDGGVLHSVVEQDGTLLVMGWDGGTNRRGAVFGSVIDRCIAISPVPVLVCRPGSDERTSRVVLLLRDDDFSGGTERGLGLAFEVARRLARYAEVDTVVLTDLSDEVLRERLDGRFSPDRIVTDERVLRRLSSESEPGDVVMTVAPPTAVGLGRGARRIADAAVDRTVVVAVPH